MKIHPADTATLHMDGVTITLHVEDASKGDVISGKVLAVSGESIQYKVDGIYEFPRSSIKSS